MRKPRFFIAGIACTLFAVWLTLSQSPQARIVKHKMSLTVIALVKTPRERPATDWREVAPAPVPLLEAAGASVDGKIYVFGGIERPSLFELIGSTKVHVYDPETDAWSRGADMPSGLTHVVPAVDGHEVWFAGGWSGSRAGGFEATHDVWIYDTIGENWRKGPPIPDQIASGGLVRRGRRLHFFGGFLGEDDTQMSEAHWALSIDEGTEWESLAPLPQARGHVSVALVGDKIYAIGGMHSHHVNAKDTKFVHVYDPTNDRWEACASLPGRRSHFESSTFVSDGKIYVLGGKNINDNFIFRERGLPDIHVYDPKADSWTDLQGLPNGLLGAIGAVIDGHLYVTTGSLISVFHGQAETYIRPWPPEA